MAEAAWDEARRGPKTNRKSRATPLPGERAFGRRVGVLVAGFSALVGGCAIQPLGAGRAPSKAELEAVGESHGFKATSGRIFSPGGGLQIQLALINRSVRAWELVSVDVVDACDAPPARNGWKLCLDDERGRPLALSCREPLPGAPERAWLAVNDSIDVPVDLLARCYGVPAGSHATVRASFDSELHAEAGGPVVGRLHVETREGMRVQFVEPSR